MFLSFLVRARCPNSITSLTSCQRSVNSSTHRCSLNFIQSFRDRVINGLHFGRFFFQKIFCLHVVVTVTKNESWFFFVFELCQIWSHSHFFVLMWSIHGKRWDLRKQTCFRYENNIFLKFWRRHSIPQMILHLLDD